MEIIPAVYILDGKCVSLYKGSLKQKETYYTPPLEMARKFVEEGANFIHIEDINGVKEGGIVQKQLIREIIENVDAKFQLAAGIRDMETLEEAFELGADRVLLEVSALPIFKSALEKYGPEKIIIWIKAKGKEITSDLSSVKTPFEVLDFAEETLLPLGVKKIVIKDIWREGTMIHPNYDEVDKVVTLTGLEVYSEGGVGDLKHIKLLKTINATGVIIGKAFYEGILTFKDCLDKASR